MNANDVFLLQAMIEREHQRSAPAMPPARHQTFFVAKQLLKKLNPGHDDLLSGIVDGEKDCGVDGMYLFANSLCVRDETPLKVLGRRARLDLYILQVKNTSGFTESPIEKLMLSLPKLLVFGRDEESLAETVNSRLIEISRRFLDTYRTLDLPELRIFVVFASLKAQYLHPGIERKGEELKQCLSSLFGAAEPSVRFLDAAAVADLSREPVRVTRKLQLAENPISTDTAGGYVAVVRLSDYERFITGANGELDGTLFEANVRDYEGATDVNKSIQETLETVDADEDFWWLNNGVTVVASRVRPANKMLELESPQIVNGLQTSTEIYKRKPTSYRSDNRSVLIKVIEAKDNVVRDRIIRATNSQTEFGPSALRATDRVQRQIEEYLLDRGLYYERRRRYYFNLGMPVERIVSIDQIGQSVLSVLVQTPHVARANPSTIFDKGVYEVVFDNKCELATYYSCIKILRAAADHLTIDGGIGIVEDYQYHLAMLLGMVLTGQERPRTTAVARLEDADFTTATARDLVKIIQHEYEKAHRSKRILMLDRLAKDELITEQLRDRGKEYLRGECWVQQAAVPAADGRRSRAKNARAGRVRGMPTQRS
ncbi:AIPR family protein [Micromonospora sp. DT47]|uniref:AIPR family protein n=1 Tax=Micromonospora sp. DT47 TaxID=3393431 RepID=UPI003CF5F729